MTSHKWQYWTARALSIALLAVFVVLTVVAWAEIDARGCLIEDISEYRVILAEDFAATGRTAEIATSGPPGSGRHLACPDLTAVGGPDELDRTLALVACKHRRMDAVLEAASHAVVAGFPVEQYEDLRCEAEWLATGNDCPPELRDHGQSERWLQRLRFAYVVALYMIVLAAFGSLISSVRSNSAWMAGGFHVRRLGIGASAGMVVFVFVAATIEVAGRSPDPASASTLGGLALVTGMFSGKLWHALERVAGDVADGILAGLGQPVKPTAADDDPDRGATGRGDE